MNLKIILIISLCLIYTHAKFRIVGGENANIENYPYQVSLLYWGSHICGGTIIGLNTIVTAAHCTDKKSINALSIRYNSSYVNRGGSVIKVKEVRQHPKYVPINIRIDYDVSVLILESPIEDAENRKAKLANNNLEFGTKCNVTGWGLTSEEIMKPAEHLQKLELQIQNLNVCNYTYGGIVTDRYICAGLEETRNVCMGDSGGPLVVNNTLYGIVSYGFILKGKVCLWRYGMYTSVLAVEDFINANMIIPPPKDNKRKKCKKFFGKIWCWVKKIIKKI